MNNDQIVEMINNLKAGNVLALVIDDDLMNLYELKHVQIKSYENLFNSYINNTCEEANKFNLDSFLDKYTKLTMDIDYIKKEILIRTLGEDNLNLLNKSYAYIVNYEYMTRTIYLSIKKEGAIK